MSACTTSVPARSMTLTGTTNSVPVGDRREVRRVEARLRPQRRGGLLQILDVHRLGNPAVAGRHRGLHQHAHRDLGGVARRNGVHGVQVVIDEEPLGHGDLGEAGLHPHHVRHDRGEIGHPHHRRRREQPGAAGPPGESFPHLIGGARSCHAGVPYSGVRKRAAERPPSGRLSGGQRFGGRPDLGHTVRVALSRVTPGRAYDRRPNGRIRSQLRSRRIFRRGRVRVGRHTRPRGPVNHRQVNSGGDSQRDVE